MTFLAFLPIKIRACDLEFVSSRAFAPHEIIRLFRIHPSDLGELQGSSGSFLSGSQERAR